MERVRGIQYLYVDPEGDREEGSHGGSTSESIPVPSSTRGGERNVVWTCTYTEVIFEKQ